MEGMPGMQGMDHSSMMASSFYFSTEASFFFKVFDVNSPAGLACAMIIFTGFTVLYEGFKCLRVNIAEKDGDRWHGIPCLSRAHVIQTVLFVFEMMFGYIIMLTVMTFNAWLLLAVLLGSAIGYHLCQVFSHQHRFHMVVATTGAASLATSSGQSEKQDVNDNSSQDEELLNCEQEKGEDSQQGPDECERLTAV